MNFRKIGISAPPYTPRSAGISVLHFLTSELRAYGFDAYIIPFPPSLPFSLNSKLDTPLCLDAATGGVEELQNEWVVLYPEVVPGNPLAARHVVRYLLNFEGAFGGPGMQAAPTDTLITYSRLFHPTAPVLCYPVFDPDLLVRARHVSSAVKRERKAFYIGKGALDGPCPEIPGAVQITRGWPNSKTELHDLLQSVDVFYTYDWLTSLCLDAALLGCEVRFLGGGKRYDSEALFRSDLEFTGFYERCEENGLPFIPRNSSKAILDKVLNFKVNFPIRMVAFFSEIAKL
jgi:hypothetical protein